MRIQILTMASVVVATVVVLFALNILVELITSI